MSTVGGLALGALAALRSPEQFRMIQALVAAVTELAFQPVRASIFVNADWFVEVPVLAGLLRVDIQVRFPSEIMPVMCVHAILLLVVALRIWTPHRLIVKVVEVYVCFVLLNQVDRRFDFRMCERAVFTVLTFSTKAHRAKLSSVLVRVVKLLHPSVTVNAWIPLRALLLFGNIAA